MRSRRSARHRRAGHSSAISPTTSSRRWASTAAREAIARARADGFAIVREEFEVGLVAAAAPIRDPAGRVIAALNVSAPSFRFEDRLEEAARLLVEVAGELSAELRGELQPA